MSGCGDCIALEGEVVELREERDDLRTEAHDLRNELQVARLERDAARADLACARESLLLEQGRLETAVGEVGQLQRTLQSRDHAIDEDADLLAEARAEVGRISSEATATLALLEPIVDERPRGGMSIRQSRLFEMRRILRAAIAPKEGTE